MKYKAIVLFGPPCAGKGTATESLQKNKKYKLIQSGQIVREEIQQKTQTGQTFLKYISKGELIPDELIVKLFLQKLQEMIQTKEYKPDKQILLIDGMFRTPQQANLLGQHFDVKEVYHFTNLPNIVLVNRGLQRAKTQHRTDDTEEAVRHRVKDYYKSTYPTLDYFYENKIPIHPVDALQPIPKMQADLLKHAKKNIKNYF